MLISFMLIKKECIMRLSFTRNTEGPLKQRARGHSFMTLTKNDWFYDPLHPQKWTVSANTYQIWRLPTPSLLDVINACFLRHPSSNIPCVVLQKLNCRRLKFLSKIIYREPINAQIVVLCLKFLNGWNVLPCGVQVSWD